MSYPSHFYLVILTTPGEWYMILVMYFRLSLYILFSSIFFHLSRRQSSAFLTQRLAKGSGPNCFNKVCFFGCILILSSCLRYTDRLVRRVDRCPETRFSSCCTCHGSRCTRVSDDTTRGSCFD